MLSVQRLYNSMLLFKFLSLFSFFFLWSPSSRFLHVYVGGGGADSGCAGGEYELPGRQALFCLEDCCQHSQDG